MNQLVRFRKSYIKTKSGNFTKDHVLRTNKKVYKIDLSTIFKKVETKSGPLSFLFEYSHVLDKLGQH